MKNFSQELYIFSHHPLEQFLQEATGFSYPPALPPFNYSGEWENIYCEKYLWSTGYWCPGCGGDEVSEGENCNYCKWPWYDFINLDIDCMKVQPGKHCCYNSPVNAQGEEWYGGAAPSAANAGGYDVLTHTLVKTADATFLCLSNVQNYA